MRNRIIAADLAHKAQKGEYGPQGQKAQSFALIPVPVPDQQSRMSVMIDQCSDYVSALMRDAPQVALLGTIGKLVNHQDRSKMYPNAQYWAYYEAQHSSLEAPKVAFDHGVGKVSAVQWRCLGA